MNIGGSEWIIIGLLIVFLLFGSKKLPEFSRMIGKAVGEYEKARIITHREFSESISSLKGDYVGPKVVSPLNSEREKLEMIAHSLGIEFTNESDDELRKLISNKMGLVK